jgi:hypothetical protein
VFKIREEIINLFAPINLINDDYGIAFELFLFASNIEEKFVLFWILFFFFLKKI